MNLFIKVSKEKLLELSETFNLIEKKEGIFEYKSPNGYFESTLDCEEYIKYGVTSFSLPTFDIEKYFLIAEDLIDYKNFMDSFEKDTLENIMKEKGVF